MATKRYALGKLERAGFGLVVHTDADWMIDAGYAHWNLLCVVDADTDRVKAIHVGRDGDEKYLKWPGTLAAAIKYVKAQAHVDVERVQNGNVRAEDVGLAKEATDGN